jgi:hypothetical protein
VLNRKFVGRKMKNIIRNGVVLLGLALSSTQVLAQETP